MATTTRPAPAMQIKAVPATLLSTDADEGIVEILVSVTGIKDLDDDIIEPGAYAETLIERRPKGVRFHRWDKPVSRAEEIEEWLPGDSRLPAEISEGVKWPAEAGGLYVKAKYNMKTQAGRDAFEDAKFYGETGDGQWSIGYSVPRGKSTRDKDGTRRIKSLNLYEWSDVLHGAAPLSRTMSIKGLDGDPDDEGDLVDVPVVDVGEEPAVDEVTGQPAAPAENPTPGGTEAPEEQPVDTPTPAEAGVFALEPVEEVAGEKVIERLPGSYEDLRDRLRSVIDEALAGPVGLDGEPAWYPTVVGTWPGHVVVTRYQSDGGNSESFDIPYTDADGQISLGTPAPVRIRLAVEADTGSKMLTESAADLLDDAAAVIALAVGHAGTKAAPMLTADRLTAAANRLHDALTAAGLDQPSPGEAAPQPVEGKTDPAVEQTAPASVQLDRADIDALLDSLRTEVAA